MGATSCQVCVLRSRLVLCPLCVSNQPLAVAPVHCPLSWRESRCMQTQWWSASCQETGLGWWRTFGLWLKRFLSCKLHVGKIFWVRVAHMLLCNVTNSWLIQNWIWQVVQSAVFTRGQWTPLVTQLLKNARYGALLEPKHALKCPPGSQNVRQSGRLGAKTHTKVPSWEPKRALKLPLGSQNMC